MRAEGEAKLTGLRCLLLIAWVKGDILDDSQVTGLTSRKGYEYRKNKSGQWENDEF